MQISANSIRQGNVLDYQNRLWVVAKQPMHTKPGKGGAFVQVELKDVKSGTKLNERFRSTESVEKVRLDEIEHQFLYFNDDNIVLMNNETYEQIEISKSILDEDKLPFLVDNMIVSLELYEESPVALILPETVVLEIVEADAVIKGQTATASYKPAILSNGVRILVPPFVTSGEKVVVRTEDASYVERFKS